jgi:AcrR family transcriptional regulator
MAKDVKSAGIPGAAGSGDVRRGSRAEQARATRRRIIDAAGELFLAQGYTATMLDQVAERAGVAVQTVYFHFGNKPTLLKEALDVAAVGDDEPVPMLERPWMEQLRTEPDPGRIIDLWVTSSRAIMLRLGPIMRVVHDAAGSDPELAARWAMTEQQRLADFRTLPEALAVRDALKPGLSIDEATDMAFTLSGVEVYWLLTSTCGWSVSRWQEWTVTMLSAALLR